MATQMQTKEAQTLTWEDVAMGLNTDTTLEDEFENDLLIQIVN